MNGKIVVVDDNEHRINNQDIHYKMRSIWNARLLKLQPNDIVERTVSISYRSTFQSALESGVDWIAMISVYTAVGNLIKLYKCIDEFVNANSEVPVFGHIMNRSQFNELKLAPHVVVVNLKAMRQRMGWVNKQHFFGLSNPWSNNLTVCGYEASADCIHDNYTPMWVKPDVTALATTVKSQFGTNVISGCLLAGCEVLNIPNNIRALYAYAYPEKWTRFDHIYRGGQDASEPVCEAYCRLLAPT